MRVGLDTVLLGKGNIIIFNEQEKIIFGAEFSTNYSKMVHNGEFYTCLSDKEKLTNDSYAKISNSEYVQILKIVYQLDEIFVLVKCLDIQSSFMCNHIKSFVHTNRIIKISVNNIIGKCLIIKTNKFNCIAEFPNKFQKY